MSLLEVGQVLEGPNDSYLVQHIMGEGGFGAVYSCATQRWTTSKYAALKLIKDPDNYRAAMDETEVMQVLREHEADQHHIVRWFSTFVANRSMILEFELLNLSLFHFLQCNGKMNLMDIRPVIIQMATAMKFLKGLGLIHGDVKPENIVFVNHAKGPKVKMIDFGSAHWSAAVTKGDFLGTLYYLAPEVVLGAHFNEAIDIWSFGCTVIEMLTGRWLFPVDDNIHLMSHIEKAVGSIPNSVLKKGVRTNTFYHQNLVNGKKVWTLKTKDSNHTKRPIKNLKSLSCLGHHYHSPSNEQKVDWEHFVDLTQRMFGLDPQTRITPEEVLGHPFVSMSHLSTFSTKYVTNSAGLMHDVSSLPCFEAMLQPEEQPSTSKASVTAETQRIKATPGLKSILVRRQKLSASSHDSVKLIKFADDTTLIGLISNNDESAYRREVDRLVSWCSGNNLELNAQKTVEMIVDFRKSTVPPPPPSVMDSPITSVESFRFLGTTITQDLKWEPTISSLIKKAQQRMYFLRQLRKAKLPAQMLVQFYTAIIESILTSSITVWFAGATVRDKQRLQRIVRSAEEVIGRSLPSLQDLQEAAVHQD
uniref:Protein kinase domain-containing protein n=1 Tax=Knipowitschia caucasica TaxID=637954 RepID=A0AAV2LJX2_KNICA